MVYTLRFLSSSKCSLFHDSKLFGSCIIHILYTWCAKIKKKIIPAPKVNKCCIGDDAEDVTSAILEWCRNRGFKNLYLRNWRIKKPTRCHFIYIFIVFLIGSTCF